MDTSNTPIVPETLERAFIEQRSLIPADIEALDRVLAYLKLARPTTQEIKDVVMDYYSVSPTEIDSQSRTAAHSFARHMICYFCRTHTRAGVALIARRVGYNDHSSVVYGIQKITSWAVSRAVIRHDIEQIKLRLAEKILHRPNKVVGRC
jgi:chromosomal replication initiator protein